MKDFIRRKQVTVNGILSVSPEQKIDETRDVITCRGQVLEYQPYVYYMLNKPQGVISATTDKADQTVLDMLIPFLPDCDKKRKLVPVGRLDKDTEGLMLLTDDGTLVHNLLSPKKHVNKTYLVKTAKPLSGEDISALEQGVDIQKSETDGEKSRTLPARAALIEDNLIALSIHEGRFHQVKRMLRAVGNEVLALKRIRFGPLQLDPALKSGEARELTKTERELLQYANRMSSGQPIMAGVHAIIFDLDGTLVDSMGMWHQIDIEYLGKFGIPLPDQLQESIEGMSFHETAVYFRERFHIPDSLDAIKADWNRMAWDKYERDVPLKSGVREFLQDCKKRGIKLGIATSNSRELVDHILESHGLSGYFTCIKTGCEVLKGKPAPDIYLAAAEGLEVEPKQCLVFEDILPGIMAGKNAGMKVCAVEDSYSADIRAEKMKMADYFIADYAEIALV